MSHTLNNNENRDCVECVHNSGSILSISRHMEGGGSYEEQRIDGRVEWTMSELNDATKVNFTTMDTMVPEAVISEEGDNSAREAGS